MARAPARAGARVKRGTMPSKISGRRLIAYLRTLAETGNATLAAERAGVSRSWAYARRKVDPRFDAWFREMMVRFEEGTPAAPLPAPHPSAAYAAPSLSLRGRGAKKRTRVNRDRA